MKVMLTKPTYLHEDLGFERHICKSIVFYCNMCVCLFDRIFMMVLRDVYITVKMMCFCHSVIHRTDVSQNHWKILLFEHADKQR